LIDQRASVLIFLSASSQSRTALPLGDPLAFHFLVGSALDQLMAKLCSMPYHGAGSD
jgi:hypothetical protein